jgi:hypothetical protein
VTAQKSGKRQLDRFDRDLLAFTLSWAPYGGPPENECFVEFGMSTDRVRERCMEVVCAARAVEYGDTECAMILRCRRLLLSSPSQRDSRSNASLNTPKVNRFVRRAALVTTLRPADTGRSATSSPARMLPPLWTQQ